MFAMMPQYIESMTIGHWKDIQHLWGLYPAQGVFHLQSASCRSCIFSRPY